MASGRLQSAKFAGTTDQLDITKLDKILEVLRHCNFSNSNWFELGINLGLLQPTLKNIEAKYNGNVGQCLLECLSLWLNKTDNANFPTWPTLAGAFDKMNQKAVAQNILKLIANPAVQLLKDYSDRLAQIYLPEDSVHRLHTEGVISKETLDEVQANYGLLLEGSLRAICTTVAEDHNKLRVFAKVLLQVADHKTKNLAKELLNDCNGFISATSIVPSQPNEASVQSLQSNDDIYIGEMFNAEFDQIRALFGDLRENIAELVIQKVSSVDDLKSFLWRRFCELHQKVVHVTSIKDIMNVIEEGCTIINIVPMETLVARFEITEANERIAEYNKVLDKFCLDFKLNYMLDKELLPGNFLTCETLNFVVDWKPDQHSLNDIRRLLERAFKHLNKRVTVRSIHSTNSIVIVCYAPHYLMDALLLEVQTNFHELEEKRELIQLTIGHYCVYDRNSTHRKTRLHIERIRMSVQTYEEQIILKQTLEILDTSEIKTDKEGGIFDQRALTEVKAMNELRIEKNEETSQETERKEVKIETADEIKQLRQTKQDLTERIKELEEKLRQCKTEPETFDELLLSVGVFPDQMKEPILQKYGSDKVDCQSLKEFIVNSEIKIKVRRALVLFSGLPKSGKSRAFDVFVKDHIKTNPFFPAKMKKRRHAPNDISHYDLIAAAESQQVFTLTEATKESSCAFGILSAFQQQLEKVEKVSFLDDQAEPTECFKNYDLSDHLKYMYQYLCNALGSEEKAKRKNEWVEIPEEYALVNVWDVPTNNIIHHILLQLQGHLTKSYQCQFLNLERDLKDLQKPPEMEKGADNAIVMKWRPRLHYLLRSCKMSKGTEGQKVVTIFAEHDGKCSREDITNKVNELEDVLRPAAKHIGVSKLLNDSIETINVPGHLQPLSQKIKEIVSKSPYEEIPIAWVFLRTFFHLSDEKFISRDELENLAEECGIDKRSLGDFCKFYTSFGSIFDLSLINGHYKYVIIKPIHFLRMLRSFLRPNDDMRQQFPTIEYGIIPERAGKIVFGADWPAYIDALVCINLATEVKVHQLLGIPDDFDPNSKYYYIPLSRTGPPVTRPDPDSIHLITSVNSPHVFKEVTLVRKLLDSMSHSKLVACANSNQMIIKDTESNTTLTSVSYGPAVKLHLDKPNVVFCKAVVKAYDEMARSANVTIRYKFVKYCVEENIPDAQSLPSALYHVLPTNACEGVNSLCEKCEQEHDCKPLLKAWNKALKECPIQDDRKSKGQMKQEEKNWVADELAAHADLDVIADTFGFPEYKSNSDLNGLPANHIVRKLISLWEVELEKTKGAQELRRALARKITRDLWCEITLNDKEKDWNKRDFAILANKVDLYWHTK